MSFKRIIILVALVVIVAGFGYAQPPTKSDTQEKKKSKLNTYRSRSSSSSDDLLNEAEKESAKDPSSALDKVQEALAESIAQNNEFNEGRSYLLLGDINSQIPEWKLAVQNYQKAYDIFKNYRNGKSSVNGSGEFKRALQGLAKSNLEAGNYQAALNNNKELLDLNLSKRERQETQLALSEVQYRMGNYDESLKIAQNITPSSAPKAMDADNDSRLVLSQQQNMLAKNYARKNDVSNTTRALDSSVNVLRNQPASGAGFAALEETNKEVANTLRDNGRVEDEIAVRNQAIEFNLSSNSLPAVTKDKIELSRILEAKGETSKALKELVEAAAIADTIDDPKAQANAYLSLAGLYEKNGQSNNALSAYRKYSEAVRKSEIQLNKQMEQRSILLKKQEDIEELSAELYVDRSEDNAQQALIARQRVIIFSLGAILMLIGVASVFVYRSAQSSKRANQLLALKSLRSQMNPHFIFNALNSVNHFIAQQDERTANRFLSEFSQLMRLVLENSQEGFITLQKEQEILSLYMKLEHYRFRDKFNYEIEIDESINFESVVVPPMLIQPYLENAVWHGLRYRDTVGFLKLTIKKNDGSLLVTITDNGIGRKKSAELKTENQKKHKSTGLKNIRERLEILNNVYRTHYEVNVRDGVEGEGTVVEIKIPGKTGGMA
ncbi:MAG: histidine kinase [Bacteroidota bacterium]